MAEEQPKAFLSVPSEKEARGAGFVAVDDEGDQTVRMTYDDLPGSWIFDVEGKLVNGNVITTTLVIAQRDPANPRPISQAELRKAPIGTLLDRVKSALRVPWNRRVPHLMAQIRTHLPKQGRSRPPEHYIQVAWYYTYAKLAGRAPRKVIANHWGVAPVTVSRWLAEARRRGYLPDYQPGADLGRDPEYPKTPEEHSEAYPKMREATNKIEEQIFLKVYREQMLSVFEQSTTDQNEGFVSHAVELLADALLGNSDGARRLRAKICVNELLRLAENAPEVGIRRTVTVLLMALNGQKHR